MSEGIHGTLRVGTAGELKGTYSATTVVGYIMFQPDGADQSIMWDADFAVFTADALKLPTRPLAVIETDNLRVRGVLDRDGHWRSNGQTTYLPHQFLSFLDSKPWHVVFEGVEEQ